MAIRRKPLSRQGFTLIELLLVIGVIGILSAIAFFGFQAVQRNAATKKTTTLLGNAASMFAEYDNSTGLRRQPAYMWKGTGAGTKHQPADGVYDIWRDADPDVGGPQRIKPVASLADESLERKAVPVMNTAVVMAEMAKVPGVKAMFSQLPAESTAVVPTETAAGVLLDGWGNPIVFVPASGLDVALGDPAAAYVVTSAKTYTAAQLPSGTLAPNARPFFASAGPDGILSFGDANGNGNFDPGEAPGGDDNVYSFGN